jgi:hypothetical protein
MFRAIFASDIYRYYRTQNTQNGNLKISSSNMVGSAKSMAFARTAPCFLGSSLALSFVVVFGFGCGEFILNGYRRAPLLEDKL